MNEHKNYTLKHRQIALYKAPFKDEKNFLQKIFFHNAFMNLFKKIRFYIKKKKRPFVYETIKRRIKNRECYWKENILQHLYLTSMSLQDSSFLVVGRQKKMRYSIDFTRATF